MLHGVLIKDSQASYYNKWVRTIRFEEEKKYGAPLYPTIGSLGTKWGLMKVIVGKFFEKFGLKTSLMGRGTGNTSVEYHNGQLLALHEGDSPYMIRLPDLETLGKLDYNGKLKHNFTAHPKVDSQVSIVLFYSVLIRFLCDLVSRVEK